MKQSKTLGPSLFIIIY